jgi:cytochrome b6-f complex iron-sulfur subunit
VWFALPRLRAGEFGSDFRVELSDLPPIDSDPQDNPAGRFWLVNIGQERASDPRQPADYPARPGVVAIYKVCVHLGCLYKWVPVNDRFECPCHGSKYLASGARVDGPATRNLDVFVMTFFDEGGQSVATTEGADPDTAPIVVPPNAAYAVVHTGRRLQGSPNTRPGGGV